MNTQQQRSPVYRCKAHSNDCNENDNNIFASSSVLRWNSMLLTSLEILLYAKKPAVPPDRSTLVES